MAVIIEGREKGQDARGKAGEVVVSDDACVSDDVGVGEQSAQVVGVALRVGVAGEAMREVQGGPGKVTKEGLWGVEEREAAYHVEFQGA